MGYTKYDFQVVKLDKAAYWPRADKPMNMVVKEWDKAILVSQMWHSEKMRKAYFHNDEVAKQVRPTLYVGGRMRGARFTSASEWENVPYGDNESDIEALKAEHERRYKQATLDNTASRVQMMLGMLGDVQVIDSADLDYSSRNTVRWNTKYKLLKVKDCKLILFEPEEVR